MAPDLRDLLHDAAHSPAGSADLDDIRRRARGVRRERRMRAASVAVVVLVVVAAGAVQWRTAPSGRVIDLVDTPPTAPEAEPTAGQAKQSLWEPLPASPLSPRVSPVAVWTGRQMLVWGGQSIDEDGIFEGLSDGAAYDPAAASWEPIERGPVRDRQGGVGVWTGSELLVWSGNGPGDRGGGVAGFDPVTGSWRELPAPPIPLALHASAVWTDDEMIMWGGYGEEPSEGAADGAAYDPKTDSWRELPHAPIAGRFYHSAVWTGTEMIIWGGGAGDGAGSHQFDDGAAYDPATDTWRAVAPAPLQARSDAKAVWTGAEMLVLGGIGQSTSFLSDAAAYEPSTDSWRPLDASPHAGTFDTVWADDRLLVRGDLSKPASVFAYPMNRWTRMENTDLAGAGAVMVLAGDEILLWGGDRDPMSASDGGPMNTGASIAVADLPPAVSQDFLDDMESAPATEVEVAPVLWPIGEGGPWREDPTSTAEAFGRLVLGWQDARVTDGEPSEDGRFGERLTLSSRHAGSAVAVLVVPEGRNGGYAVAQVGVDQDENGNEYGLRVSIRGRRAQVEFDPRSTAFEGATSATARIEYGTGFGYTAELPKAPPWDFDILLPFSRKGPGTLLILVHDADGRVIGATGAGLPPGDHTSP